MATPNRNLSLAMLQHEFIVAIRLWLGISIFLAASSNNASRCECGQVINRFGGHLLMCSYDSTMLKRHNALCDILWYALLSDNNSCRREQNCSANHQSCPGDIYHPHFLSGNPAFWYHCPQFIAFVCAAAIEAGAAGNAGEMEKDKRLMSLM